MMGNWINPLWIIIFLFWNCHFLWGIPTIFIQTHNCLSDRGSHPQAGGPKFKRSQNVCFRVQWLGWWGNIPLNESCFRCKKLMSKPFLQFGGARRQQAENTLLNPMVPINHVPIKVVLLGQPQGPQDNPMSNTVKSRPERHIRGAGPMSKPRFFRNLPCCPRYHYILAAVAVHVIVSQIWEEKHHNMEVSWNEDTPKWLVIMENTIEMDDLEVPLCLGKPPYTKFDSQNAQHKHHKTWPSPPPLEHGELVNGFYSSAPCIKLDPFETKYTTHKYHILSYTCFTYVLECPVSLHYFKASIVEQHNGLRR